jgi:RNA polymerase sigma factor (sigma-70 family)
MIKRLGSRGALYYHLETLFGQGTSIGSTEGELLDRFVNGRDGAAFEALVARHGPMVLGVCKQLLRDPNDVDDAFQATFLVLVRKAGSLRRCDLLGNWLYGVAYRVAARARSQSARNLARVASGRDSVASLSVAECPQPVGTSATSLLDQSPLLHKELSVLPEKYRIPIVLCYFEGLTHDEAASRLGWPLGTVKGRLARARDLLRRRLTSRGVTFSATALAAQLAAFEAKGAVPASLQMITLKGAQTLAYQLGASLATNTAASLSAYALAEGVLHAMVANQVKTVALPLLLIAGTMATGVGLAATRLSGGAASDENAQQVPAASTVSAKSQSRGAGGSTTTSADSAASPISPLLSQQLSAESTAFGQLLSRLGDPEIVDIDRLDHWSSKTAEADQELATSDADRLAAHEAHRDRMKRLVELTQKIPAWNSKRSAKIDHAQDILRQADERLKFIRQFPGTPGMMGMMKMMGRETGAIGRMGGIPAGGRGQMGMGGFGGGRAGMMGAMMGRPGSGTVRDEAKPASSQAGARDDLDQGPKTAAKAQSSTKTTTSSSGNAVGSGARGQSAGGGLAGMGGGMSAGGGGKGGGMAGMMGGQMSAEANRRRLLSSIAVSAAELAARDTNPQSKAILKKLESPISMSFSEDASLELVLKYIKQATATNNDQGIPIYVDPKGLKEAEATLQSPVQLNLEGVPLKTTFRLILKQIGLAYCVRDGVLIVSSVEGIAEELAEAQSELQAVDPQGGAGLGGGGGGFGGGFGGGGGGMR